MIGEDRLIEAKKIIRDFFARLGEEPEIDLNIENENSFMANLAMEDPRFFIGQGGQALAAIQHLLRAMLRRGLGENIYLILDINDYRKNKISYLKDLARSAAEEVVARGLAKELPPMSAFERRVVHLEIGTREDVLTESIGEEPERRIVIKLRQ